MLVKKSKVRSRYLPTFLYPSKRKNSYRYCCVRYGTYGILTIPVPYGTPSYFAVQIKYFGYTRYRFSWDLVFLEKMLFVLDPSISVWRCRWWKKPTWTVWARPMRKSSPGTSTASRRIPQLLQQVGNGTFSTLIINQTSECAYAAIYQCCESGSAWPLLMIRYPGSESGFS